MSNIQYFPTSHTEEVKNYPYGRLRTSMFFSLEFDRKKGFRSVRQTINPKTGRMNAPKKSTYSPCMLMGINADEHVNFYGGWSFNGAKAVNDGCQWLADKAHYFSPEQRLFILQHIQVMLLCTAKAQVVYCGADGEKVMEVLRPTLAAVKRGIDEGGLPECFGDIQVDVEALDATKKEGFNPFKTITYEM